MTYSTPRWYYRFDNYRRAFTLLREAIEQETPLTQLEKEGVIQRFEYTMELAWKTLKDYLESEGVVFDQITPPRSHSSCIRGRSHYPGGIWQKALDARNRMSHTYSFATFEQVIADIDVSYLAVFDELYQFLLAQRIEVYSAPKEFELSDLGAPR